MGWCPCEEMASMVRPIRTIMNRRVLLVNIFMWLFCLLEENFCVRDIKTTITIIISKDFFVVFFSLGAIAVTYINKVIIPEEKVRIKTKEIHLINAVLKIVTEVNKETPNRIKAIVIGLREEAIFIAIRSGAIDIFLYNLLIYKINVIF